MTQRTSNGAHNRAPRSFIRKSILLIACLLPVLFAVACGSPAPGGDVSGPGPTQPDGSSQAPGSAPGAGEPDVDPTPATDQVTVTLYFADFQAQHVVPEQRTVALQGDQDLTTAIVEQLLAGPEDPYLRPILPADAELLSVDVADGIAYVNLSEAARVSGSAAEMMAMRGLVYTLTELPEIDAVQVLINGQSNLTLGGHFDLSEPAERGEILVIPIFIDEERAAWLQEQADSGAQAWRRDPDVVVRIESRMVGFTGTEDFRPLPEPESETENARVFETTVDGQTYLLTLSQPAKQGEDGIWMLTDVVHVMRGRLEGAQDLAPGAK